MIPLSLCLKSRDIFEQLQVNKHVKYGLDNFCGSSPFHCAFAAQSVSLN